MTKLYALAHDELEIVFCFCDGPTIVACLKVCKWLHDLAKNIPVTLNIKNSQFGVVKKYALSIKKFGINFNLTELNLNGFTGVDMLLKSFQKYEGVNRLKGLHIDFGNTETNQLGKPLTKESIGVICESPFFSQLKTLSLAYRYEFRDQISVLFQDPQFSQLTSVDLSGITGDLSVLNNKLKKVVINDTYLESLVLETPFPNLEELHAVYNCISEIRIGSNLPNLTCLNLHLSRISTSVLVSLSNCELDKLTDLDISGATFNDGTLELIIKKFRLKRLVLFKSTVSDGACKSITESENMSNLTSLNLGRALYCTSEGILNISQSPYLSLKRFIVDGIAMDEHTCQAISESPVFRNLTDLSLSYCGISANSMKHLVKSKNLSGLKELQLKSNIEFGSEGCKYLATSPFITKLTYLNLCNTQITNDDCFILASSNNFKNITELDISSNSTIYENEDIIKNSENFPSLSVLLVKDEYWKDENHSRPHQIDFK